MCYPRKPKPISEWLSTQLSKCQQFFFPSRTSLKNPQLAQQKEAIETILTIYRQDIDSLRRVIALLKANKELTPKSHRALDYVINYGRQITSFESLTSNALVLEEPILDYELYLLLEMEQHGRQSLTMPIDQVKEALLQHYQWKLLSLPTLLREEFIAQLDLVFLNEEL